MHSWRPLLLASFFLCLNQHSINADETLEKPQNAIDEAKDTLAAPDQSEPVDEFAKMAERSEDEQKAPPVELNGFGTGEPLERKSMPSQGLLTFPLEIDTRKVMPHWEQYDWQGQSKRSGKFRVVATYEARYSVPVQFHHQKLRLRKELPTASEPSEVTIGTVELPKGDFAFSIYSPPPPAPGQDVLHIHEVKFIPVPQEGEFHVALQMNDQGVLNLTPNQATLWSDSLILKPGNADSPGTLIEWKNPDDLAEWHVHLHPGKYACTLITKNRDSTPSPQSIQSLTWEFSAHIDGKEHTSLTANHVAQSDQSSHIPLGELHIKDTDLTSDLALQFLTLKSSAPLPDHLEIVGIKLEKVQAKQTQNTP